MSAQGWPLRAVYGPLPGPLQTVGRSERFALFMAVRHFGAKLEVVLTDLLALESEAASWGPELEGAAAAHATVWRALRAQARRPH
eukprot:2304736-Pyramimonas_sp.AAC.1